MFDRTDRNIYRFIFLVTGIITLLMPGHIKSSHIVGGFISYECLGNNEYQIHMRIYRDSSNGRPYFESIAELAVYEGNQDYYTTLSVPHEEVILLPPEWSNDPCVTYPPNYYIHYTDYYDTVHLPANSSGYVITYDICCRNYLISNLWLPGNSSSTFTVDIPPTDPCNTSPTLINNPPSVLCLNMPINFTMEMEEPDGDSLYYQLCEAYQAGFGCGNIPCPPPYPTVKYKWPFNGNYPIPSQPPIKIDSVTGVITGTPKNLGVYVVAVCVQEYDSIGLLKSEWRLDYQYSVVQCRLPARSDMVTPAEDPFMVCNGLTVNFISESDANYDLYWNFGDPNTSGDTSNAIEPVYTFPEPGIYPVMLVVDPYDPCADTLIVNFEVFEQLDPNFEYSGETCFDYHGVTFRLNGIPDPETSYDWYFGPEANIAHYSGTSPPVIKWSRGGRHYVDLVMKRDSCVETRRESVFISGYHGTLDAGPDQTIQAGEVAYLMASDGVDFYWWADKTGIEISSRITQSSSIRFEEADSVKIYLWMRDSYGCEGVDSLMIYVLSNEVRGIINFISPDGNGLNEVLDLSEINPHHTCDINIMNRWGAEIWTQKNYANDWRGVNFGGYPVPDGTYYFVLSCDGEFKYGAAVTLIRNP